MFEVQAAQLGSSKATDAAVKGYASMLVDHHTAANNELVQLANSKKVELPAAPSWRMRRDVEKLGKKSGADFDRDFVREVGIKAHEKDIKNFQKASEKVKDPQLKVRRAGPAARRAPTRRAADGRAGCPTRRPGGFRQRRWACVPKIGPCASG